MEPYQKLLLVLQAALEELEKSVGRPVVVPAGSRDFMFRLPNVDIHSAIFLKLVAMLSSLNAARILLTNGHVMEQAAVERIADEAAEDVFFLTLGVLKGTTDLHKRFLDAFWAEEFDDFEDTMGSHRSRPMIPRDKIRAQVHGSHPEDPSTATKAARILTKTYSGFVHLAAPHVMEVYRPDVGSFSVNGMLGTPRASQYHEDFWNYLYRGGMAFLAAAQAFGADQLREQISEGLRGFQQATGREY